jgi:hypothetical protein
VHKCKTKSIILESREETTRPPKNGRELVQINAMAALAEKEGQANK